MILAFDINGNLIQFNHAASVEFGWTFDDAKQLRPKQFLADESEFADVMSELKEKNHFVGELTGLRSSGETFQLLMSVASLRDDDGNTLGAVTVGRDITGLQIAEQELRRSEERYQGHSRQRQRLGFLGRSTRKIHLREPVIFQNTWV